MSVYVGTNKINKMYRGSTPLNKVMLGMIELFPNLDFDPKSLFAANDVGFIYDNDDLSAMFADSAGAAPALVNGPVGLQLDKSKALTIGPELTKNGNFDSGATSWLTTGSGYSFSNGQAVLTSVADGQSIYQTGVVVIGKWYSVTIDVASLTSGIIYPAIGGLGSGTTINSAGIYRFIMRANANSNANIINTGVTSCVINSFSVKEISGNHRYQTTPSSRPTLRGTPIGNNLAVNGGFDTDTNWVKNAGWAISGGKATKTAGTPNTLYQLFTFTVGRTYRLRMTVSGATAGTCAPFLGSGSTVAGPLLGTNGVREVYLTAVTGNAYFGVTADGVFNGSIDDFEVHDVSADVVTAPYGLQANGTSTFMQTANVDFSASDEATLVFGSRKLTDATTGVVVSLGNVGSADGSFEFRAPWTAGVANIGVGMKGPNGASAATYATFTAPISLVTSFEMDFSGGSAAEIVAKVNGVLMPATGTDTGDSQFASSVMYFGRRGGTALPYNGLDYGGVCINKLLSANELTLLNHWVAKRTGVTL